MTTERTGGMPDASNNGASTNGKGDKPARALVPYVGPKPAELDAPEGAPWRPTWPLSYPDGIPADWPGWAPDFLTFFERTGSVTQARTRAGIGRSQLYRFRDKDRDFAEAWVEIFEGWLDRIPEGSLRRAVEGVEKKRLVPVERIENEDGGVEINYASLTVGREFSFAREAFWMERTRRDQFGSEVADVSAAEFARATHRWLEEIDDSMDQDRPEQEAQDAEEAEA